MTQLPAMLVGAVGCLLVVASWTDLTTYRIPNWIPLAIFGLFPLFALGIQLPLDDFLLHCAAFAAALAGGFILFAWHKVGGGDVKLFAAVALWAGWGTPLIQLLVITTLLGGVLSLTILLCRWTPIGKAIGVYLRGMGWDFGIFDPAKKMAPYGVAISAAFVTPLFLPQ